MTIVYAMQISSTSYLCKSDYTVNKLRKLHERHIRKILGKKMNTTGNVFATQRKVSTHKVIKGVVSLPRRSFNIAFTLIGFACNAKSFATVFLFAFACNAKSFAIRFIVFFLFLVPDSVSVTSWQKLSVHFSFIATLCTCDQIGLIKMTCCVLSSHVL